MIDLFVNNKGASYNSTGKAVLPFEPTSLVFQDVQYYVDAPSVITLNRISSAYVAVGQAGLFIIFYFSSFYDG